MNNVIMRKIVLTASWQPLSATSLVGSVTVSTPPTNAATVLFRAAGEPAHELPWVPGQWIDLRKVDLASIEVRGTPGDLVTVMGGTW
jgi:hypothetical protein